MALIVGAVLPFAINVTNSAGQAANAGNMSLTITRDDVVVQTYVTVSPTSLGAYDVDYTSTATGKYVGYWLATGVNSGARTQVFVVESATDPSLMSLEQAKKHLGKSLTSTADDDELELFMRAATTWVENEVGPIAKRTVVEDHWGGRSVIQLNATPVVSLTSIAAVSGGSGVSTGALTVTPNGAVYYLSGFGVMPNVLLRFTYIVGRSTIPEAFTLAALTVMKGLWESQRGAAQLPLAASEVEDVPGVGLVLWRARQLLAGESEGPSVG